MRALLDGALLEGAAAPAPEPAKRPKKALPAFASASRLPAPIARGRKADASEVEALVQAIAQDS